MKQPDIDKPETAYNEPHQHKIIKFRVCQYYMIFTLV